MKSAAAGIAAHLAGEAMTLATCWRVARRDGLVLRFTDHDRDLVVAGETYSAASGYRRAAIATEAGLEVGETEIAGVLDADTVTAEDLDGGLWDYAEVRIFAVNWASPASGTIKLRRGTLGQVRRDERGAFAAELRGLAQALQQRVGETYSPYCRAELGDSRCRVPIEPATIARSATYAVGEYVRVPIGSAGTRADDGGVIWRCTADGTTAGSAPGFTPTPGATVTDGTVEWTAEEAWTVYAELDTGGDGRSVIVMQAGYLTQTRHGSDAFFTGGVVTFESGANAGVSREILAYDAASLTATLFGALPYPAVAGDALRIAPGCDQTGPTCRGRFGNYVNFRGEEHVPGQDALLRVGLPA